MRAAVGPSNAGSAGTASARPLVSVIMPVFNGGPYLVESIESVLAQTYPSIEVVVVDDASYDETPLVLERYAADGRIRYLRNSQNLGQFGSVNIGIEAADGELIAIHHADDVYFPQLLEFEVAFLEREPDVGAVFSFDVFIDAKGVEWGRADPPSEYRGDVILSYREVLEGILRYGNVFIRGGTSVVRRHVYDSVGPFDESFGLRGDLDMWLRIARQHDIGIVDKYLTRYRWGHVHLSSEYEHLRQTSELSFDVIDRELLLSGPISLDAKRTYEGRRAVDLVMVAGNLYVLGRMESARSTLKRARARRLIAATGLPGQGRVLAVLYGMRLLTRLPRSGIAATLLYKRLNRVTE
jgi:glycosyltransferase involved in cell wall biosynthesis